jgi:FlaA1/EpsC-like NDP-sugar epimerase
VNRLVKYRRPVVVLLHLALVVIVHVSALWLRFDGEIPSAQTALLLRMLPWLVVIRGLTFFPFRLYEGLWRYTSIFDLRNIIGGVLTSSVGFYLLVHWGFGLKRYPRSVFVIDALLLLVVLGGLRLTRRIYRELSRVSREKRILIYGAGDAGEMIVRDMRNNSYYDHEPVGFIDDDRTKIGQRVHGVKVLGTRQELARIMRDQAPDAILVAMPRSGPVTIREIVRTLEPFKVPIQTLPDLREILDGKVSVGQIRPLAVEDLLERLPISLEIEPVRGLISRRRVLVSGAGGSIGSELVRQISTLSPSMLVLLDRYENGLHGLATDLRSRSVACPTETVIADITDAERVNSVFATYRPEILFHAAAHKHVPLMELNPCEAVKNNVRGTRIAIEAAQRWKVERLVLISSDKAVNPSSVMGATKRIAELMIQSMHHDGAGNFSAVRFGNVLASNGSVVPLFLEQIRRGGPVTVTHPEMKRYFMLISEAVHLVLQAATLAKGADIFVLEMGEQVRVLDLARHMIRLSGCIPDEEIPITFTGLRPGEKLYEELIGDDEAVEPSSAAGILRVVPKRLPQRRLARHALGELERLAFAGDCAGVLACMKTLVPTYIPGAPGREHEKPR